MQRIEDFLKEDEVPDWACTLSAPVQSHLNGNGNGTGHKANSDSVGFRHASFEWVEPSPADTSPARFQLGPLEVAFPAGKLSVVSGPTGSGKSAFLAALLGGLSLITYFSPFN